jgi:hypothetical protein
MEHVKTCNSKVASEDVKLEANYRSKRLPSWNFDWRPLPLGNDDDVLKRGG